MPREGGRKVHPHLKWVGVSRHVLISDAPPIAPKPIALVSPEKLSFRDRLALYENKVEVNRKADARKSWAPDMFPRSGSTSPVYGKWASYSSLGNSPLHKSMCIVKLCTEVHVVGGVLMLSKRLEFAVVNFFNKCQNGNQKNWKNLQRFDWVILFVLIELVVLKTN